MNQVRLLAKTVNQHQRLVRDLLRLGRQRISSLEKRITMKTAAKTYQWDIAAIEGAVVDAEDSWCSDHG